MRAQGIREAFLDFFNKKKHKIVKSSSLLPKNDPTLLFTNAGMNQFKDLFLGLEKRSYTRAASVQKCMRVSGKHNDLEQVGQTNKHHTFFEMLGNFSFGNYFKEDAIAFAWELMTEIFCLDKNRLYITVYEKDDEAFQIWNERIGIPSEMIFRFGKKDNFWAMGETGPCGPCSEIHYDLESRGTKGDPYTHIESGSDRFLELWNLVFMQFIQDKDGKQTPLPSPSIDTGMGLERMATTLQGRSSNYETDLFAPLIEALCQISDKEYGASDKEDLSLRIIVDHIRAVSFLVGDGILPANDGRGYVLRRLIRRAYRHGTYLGHEDPFLFKLVGVVIDIMKDAYPELLFSSDYIAKICLAEEKRFSSTLSSGLRTFKQFIDESLSSEKKVLDGNKLFKLYDTFGFPLELSRELAQEKGLKIDEKGFQKELEKQRERARRAWKGDAKEKDRLVYEKLKELSVQFKGYSSQKISDTKVLALIKDSKQVDQIKEGERGEAVLDRTPFYAEAGGQASDTGILKNPHFSAVVESGYYPIPNIISQRIKILAGKIQVGDTVDAEIDSPRRKNLTRNHTATHLLHATLRAVLGDHIKQSGSLVAPERLRFDFTHFTAVDPVELEQVEAMVNEKIRDNLSVSTVLVSLEEGLQKGAIAIFEEKYGENVRLVSIDEFSKELCGGVHVEATGEIGFFKILSESSIAAGMRRIEAVSGEMALRHVQEIQNIISGIQSSLKVSKSDLPDQLDKIMASLKSSERENKALRQKLANMSFQSKEEQLTTIKGIQVLVQKVEKLSQSELRTLSDSLKQKIGTGIVILGMKENKKVFMTAAVSKDLIEKIQANSIIKELAPLIRGGGGGRPDFAQAGGSSPDELDKTLKKSLLILEKLIP